MRTWPHPVAQRHQRDAGQIGEEQRGRDLHFDMAGHGRQQPQDDRRAPEFTNSASSMTTPRMFDRMVNAATWRARP